MAYITHILMSADFCVGIFFDYDIEMISFSPDRFHK